MAIFISFSEILIFCFAYGANEVVYEHEVISRQIMSVCFSMSGQSLFVLCSPF